MSGKSDSQQILSVVIPVYNEAGTIHAILDKVSGVRIDGVSLEILVVNDGSTDGSDKLIQSWHESHPAVNLRCFDKSNGGKGSAVRVGITHSTGDFLIIQDADLEYDPADYERCIDPIRRGECKVVYGTREDANRNRLYSSPLFYLGALSLTMWVDLLFNANLTDEATCYKTFDGNLIRAIPYDGDKFEWEPEITAKLLRLGYEIREIGVSYYPRTKKAGKKIRFKDAVQGFMTALKWRFASIKKTRSDVCAISDDDNKRVRSVGHAYMALLGVFVLALIVRLAFAIPGMENPEGLLYRIDTATFMAPAQSIFEHGQYLGTDGNPTALRTPLYPLFLGFCLWISSGSLIFCIIMSCITSAASCVVLYCAARLYGSWRTAFLCALLFVFNPTAIAAAPMFLSDTLFTFFVALSLMFFLKFAKSRFAMFFMASVLFAGLGALTRPLNMLWILPCIFVLFCMRNLPLRLKASYAIFGLLIFGAFILPWTIRNYTTGAGFRFDSVSANALMHNASALESRITGENGESLRQKYELEMAREFSENPEKYSTEAERLSYQEKMMTDKIKAHPLTYLYISFRPYVLLPDIPSLLENIGITQTGRGTFDILNRQGLIAAVKHYFGGSYTALAFCIPLIIVSIVTYLLAAFAIAVLIMRREWTAILIFMLFAAYYLIMPGPVSMPRYALPALPALCSLAGFAMAGIANIMRKRFKEKKSTTGSYPTNNDAV